MIEFGEYEEFEKVYKFVSIDLTTSKHKNRVLDFIEHQSPMGNYQYAIKAKWTAEKYHPTMILSEDELIKFSDAILRLVEEINLRRKKP